MITIQNLVKRHAGLEILRGISFNVKKGEVAAVIGPSGGGKSTFLRCINGLEQFQGGEIHIAEYTLTADTHPVKDGYFLEHVRRKVGFVFQDFQLFPHLSVMDNIIEAPVMVLKKPREEAINDAKALLDRVGLLKKMDVMPRQLSGGQKQRVAICRALAMQPEVILFDEPTSALDPVMAGEVLAVMGDLARGGQTMIVVTHSMGFARGVATTVHVFSEGHDVEVGPPEQVFNNPQHPTTRSFLKEAQND